MKKVIVIAVTGGMGSGQSTVCKFLAERGVKIINADLIARREMERNNDIKKELKKAFGGRVVYGNGKINRTLLGQIAFSDESRTHRLNKIVHPHMVARIMDMIEDARSSGKYKIIAVDAALIYETNIEKMFDAVVVVVSKLHQRVERIKNRDKLDQKEIMDRIAKQLPLDEKKTWADFVVKNYDSLEKLKIRTKKLHEELLAFYKQA